MGRSRDHSTAGFITWHSAAVVLVRGLFSGNMRNKQHAQQPRASMLTGQYQGGACLPSAVLLSVRRNSGVT